MVRIYSRVVSASVALAGETTNHHETDEIEALHIFHKEEVEMTKAGLDLPIIENQRNHSARATLLRPIPYEMTTTGEASAPSPHSGQLLSLNISNGGMLVLMDQPPSIEQVMKVHVPTPITMADIPTLAEVRWTRKIPFGQSNGEGAFFVGLKFLF